MRILMLGNSFTSANDLPGQLARLTGAQVTAHTRGGARLSEHLNPSTRMGGRTQTALREQHWDFVILQEMSNGPITSPQRFLDSAGRLAEQIRSVGAVPVLYATWAYESPERLAALGLSREEMQQRMQDAFRQAADLYQLRLANVGQRFYERRPAEGLFAADGVHPSREGTALAAEALAAALF